MLVSYGDCAFCEVNTKSVHDWEITFRGGFTLSFCSYECLEFFITHDHLTDYIKEFIYNENKEN